MSGGTVRLSGASKRFTKYEDTPTLAYGLMRMWGRSRRSQLWAVQDVDLELDPGDCLGIVGRNGSGKSTLLQMLCGVTAPTRGEVHVKGRIAPLISVGVGFHPELTGRENVFVNGTILGLSRQEIAHRLDDIIAFSEIEEFIDSPVKFYSSGMFLRLGFAVAAHVDPAILVLDEILAVGDLSFQAKCYDHINSLRRDGTTIIIVSHNMSALEQHCERGIYMEAGRKVFQGSMNDAIAAYYEALEAASAEARDGIPYEAKWLDMLSVDFSSGGRPASLRFEAGDRLTVRFHVRARMDINSPYIGVSVTSDSGVLVYREHNLLDPFPSLKVGDEATFEADLDLPLVSGPYVITYALGRGSQQTRHAPGVAEDFAYISKRYNTTIHVSGRPQPEGVSDLRASFTAAKVIQVATPNVCASIQNDDATL